MNVIQTLFGRMAYSVAVLASGLLASHAHAAQYKFTELASIGIAPADINRSGWMAGMTPAGQAAIFNGTSLMTYGSGRVLSINSSGVGVGYLNDVGFDSRRAAIFNKDGTTTIIGDERYSAVDINDSGVIVGNIEKYDDSGNLAERQAWVISGGTMSLINAPISVAAISNSGVATGGYYALDPVSGMEFSRSFLWSNGVLQMGPDLGAGGFGWRINSFGVEINSSGTLVLNYSGYYDQPCPEGCYPSFEYGAYLLDVSGGAPYPSYADPRWPAIAHSLNDAGEFVSANCIESLNNRCVVNLTPILRAELGEFNNFSTGIIGAGGQVVVGVRFAGNVYKSYLLTPIPEPSTMGMMALGLFAVGVVARRRHQSRLAFPA